MTPKKMRTLADLVTQAASSLIPLASGGKDSHGGKMNLKSVGPALDALIEAGALAGTIKAELHSHGYETHRKGR